MSIKILSLKSKKDFSKILKSDIKFYSKSVIAISLPTPLEKKFDPKKNLNSNEFCRVGFIVSKKVSALATKRNRVKRLMRESFRNLSKNYCRLNFDYCLIARSNIINNDFNSIKKDIYFCLKNLMKANYDQKN